jgi:cell division initiation protein
MDISAIDIQNKQFKVKFRGFDIHEVDLFLEEMSDTFESMQTQINWLEEEIKRLGKENNGHKEREETLKRTLIHSQKIMEQMKENARKSSDIIIAGAEVKAEKILINAHAKLAELQDEIMELKRQRIKLNMGIRSILETHAKLLDLDEEIVIKSGEQDSKVKYLKI